MSDPTHLLGTPLSCDSTPCRHRHHIRKPRYRVTNWAEYDAALKRLGSLTVWFPEEAAQAWQVEPRTTPGGQSHYLALAITTALAVRMVFGCKTACKTFQIPG